MLFFQGNTLQSMKHIFYLFSSISCYGTASTNTCRPLPSAYIVGEGGMKMNDKRATTSQIHDLLLHKSPTNPTTLDQHVLLQRFNSIVVCGQLVLSKKYLPVMNNNRYLIHFKITLIMHFLPCRSLLFRSQSET